MAVQTTSNLSDSIRVQYKEDYLGGTAKIRLYDQLAQDYTEDGGEPRDMAQLMKSSSIQVNFLSDMTPGTTAISETGDLTPQTLEDATASVTWTSRAEALQWSEKLDFSVYTNYKAKIMEKIGANAMESIDVLAKSEALGGTWVERAAARASLDAGTASHRASDAIFRKYDGMMQSLMIPGYVSPEDGSASVWAAIMHPFSFHDISESGNVDVIGQYLDKGIHLNWELGQIGRFRLVVSPYAHVYGFAGIDNANPVETTVGTASTALATSLVTAADESSDSAYGLLCWVGTEETSSTIYPKNEPFKVISAVTTTLTIMGRAANGGLRFAHAAGETVANADSVYPIVFGGPNSLVRVYAVDSGPYGKLLDPKVTGLADQFTSVAWKYYGGYDLVSANRILRFEGSTSYEA